MVAKVISGKDIKGALNYNEQKVAGGIATCILASGFLKDVNALSFREKLGRFTALNERNLRTTTNTIHISLNFDPGERLSVDELSNIASNYMDRIGFGRQPFLAYQHHDAAHPHIHIVSTLIQENGKRIPIHNLGRNESERARKEIEIEFGLVRASSKEKVTATPLVVEIEKAAYGKSPTKQSISNIVRAVIRTYKVTSLPELNAVLQQYNVAAVRGSAQSKMFPQDGLVYSLIDKNGKRIGIPIKASSIYGKPTLRFLENQFKLNELLRRPFRETLKHKIERVLRDGNVKTRTEFITALQSEGIAGIFRSNSDGRTYGLTFIDNVSKVVFNGSALGKPYSANAIVDRLASKENIINVFKPGLRDRKAANEAITARDEPRIAADRQSETVKISGVILDLLSADGSSVTSPEALLKLNKRKRRRKGLRR
ncbi:MAG: relaxase/mobilization nuclease domain-containing protein [Chryseolinea sp.]